MSRASVGSPPGPGGAQTQLPTYVASLLRPSAFPHPAPVPRLVEPHISWVILAGAYVYKLRKPVNMGFVEYSNVAQRDADRQEEIRINRRLAPTVYLGVVDVVERGGTFYVGGFGRATEPAVRMRRLPDEGMLPRLLDNGTADVALARRVAGRLARFHATAATGPGVDEFGSIQEITDNWTQNSEQTEPSVGRTVEASVNQQVRSYVERFIADHRDLLLARQRAGRIRDGHGDLHAASICVEGHRLHLFDCLEFSARYRCADVASEVAFLAMDLDHYARADLARAFVEHYVHESGDEDLPRLLDFYKCYRAYVRGKVLRLRLTQPGIQAPDVQATEEMAESYFSLAQEYARDPRPQLVVVLGPPASGKTPLARELASRTGWIHVSLDAVRIELAGRKGGDYGGAGFERGLYTPSMTRRTYAALRRRAGRWLRQGRPVIVDATFGKPAERSAIRTMGKRMGVPTRMVVCVADERTLERRLAERDQPGQAHASDARLTLWPSLRAAFVPPTPSENVAAIDTSHPLRATVRDVLRLVQPD